MTHKFTINSQKPKIGTREAKSGSGLRRRVMLQKLILIFAMRKGTGKFS